MALDFPSSPTIGQTYSASGGTWIYNGNSWVNINTLTATDIINILGYTPVPTTRTLSINGTSFDLSANRSWTINASQWTTSGSNIFYNTGNVGIGTTSPGDKLDVSGSGNLGITISNSGNTSGDFSALRYFQAGSERAVCYTNQGNYVISVGSERMRITSAGNVGIGTTSPSSLLQVAGTVTASSFSVSNGSISGNGFWGTLITAGSGSGYDLGIVRSNSDAIAGVPTGTNNFYFAGRVGIGTSTPSSSVRFHVFDGSGNGDVALFESNISKADIWLKDANTSSGAVRLRSESNSMVMTAGGNERMRITSDGAVVLANSDSRLRGGDSAGRLIVGNSDTTSYITLNGNGTGNGINLITNSFISFNSGSGFAERMRITSGGNVGIGTTDFSDVSFGSSILKIAGSRATLGLNSSGSLTTIAMVAANDITKAIHINQSNSGALSIYQYSAGAETFTLSAAGNVGIGTSSPESLLHLSQASTGGNGAFIFIDNPAASTLGNRAGIRFATNTGASFSGYGSFIEAVNTDAGTGAESLTFGTWNGGSRGERMRITSGGKLLVGTTTAGFGLFSEQRVTINPTNDGMVVAPLPENNSAYTVQAANNSGTRYAMYIANGSSSVVGFISFTSSATSYSTSSDYRLKQDLKSFNGLGILSKINMYDFEWKSDKSRTHGVLAHELQEVLPYAVTGEKDGDQMQGVDYSKLVPVLVKALQEQQQQIEELKAKLK